MLNDFKLEDCNRTMNKIWKNFVQYKLYVWIINYYVSKINKLINVSGKHFNNKFDIVFII